MGKFTMKAKDSISGSMAELYVTIEENRYNFAQAITFEANFEKSKTEVPVLGRTGKGNKATGWTGSGSMTLHYNTSVMRELAYRYKLVKMFISICNVRMKIQLQVLGDKPLH